MSTGVKKVTQKQAEKVLEAAARYLGRKGMGTMSIPGDYDSEYIPVAPTGHDAYLNGAGPWLKMDWDWPSEPTPTLLLEGGPYDWAIEIGWDEQFESELPAGIRVEPYAGYALCIYRES